MSKFEVTETAGVPIKSWTRGVPFEDEARKQVANLAAMPFVRNHVAVMPDVHAGIGATVGSVIATKGAIIPAAVGVDIGCVDADTEYLSPVGWKRIADYKGGPVMQYDPDTEVGSFVVPEFIRRTSKGFLHFKTKYGIDQMLSPDHKVLCWQITGRKRTRERLVTSAEVIARTHERLVIGAKVEFKTTFNLLPSERVLGLSDAQLRLQVALMADGHINNWRTGNTVIGVKKARKCKRLRELLAAASLEYTENESKDGVATFRFKAPLITKTYADLWQASLYELSIIVDEVLHWDGNIADQVYFTRDKASADFMQYAFTVNGKRGTMRCDLKDGVPDYRVFANANTMIGLGGVPKSKIAHVPSADGMEYCFAVPSGFWVMRRGGNVVMTGNCGMIALRTSLKASDLPDNLAAIRSAIEAAVPHGRTNDGGANDRGAWKDAPNAVSKTWVPLGSQYLDIVDKYPKVSHERGMAQLGTLGTGNHFVEICLDETQAVWLMLHSGSRGVGNKIGSYFISKAREEMRRWFINLPDQDLAYLPEGSELFGDYMKAVSWAQNYARANRDLMMDATIEALRTSGLPAFNTTLEAVNCHHNYVARERHFGEDVIVTRKGAVSAKAGELGIIPGSMGAKSFIVKGKGNRDSFTSCSHGAGRAMSRTKAKQMFTVEDHIAATVGVECRKDKDVIDETPAAYKSIDAVMEAQSDLVEVVYTLKQIVCVKG